MVRWLAILAVVAASGCAGDRPQLRGGRCELNTDCEHPLVCGFGRCRRECQNARDCAAQLDCFIDATGLGYCQLEEELVCTSDADCESSCAMDDECVDLLVCRDGRCARECVTSRDCPADASCVPRDGDGSAMCDPTTPEPCVCETPTLEPCVYDSDCPEPYVCARDQECRYECVETRDCDFPRECVGNLCELP